jgi:hypothetical protein
MLINLQELYLHKNKIEEIKGLETLTTLKKLNLSNNKIEEIKGLENLTNLQELDLKGYPLQRNSTQDMVKYCQDKKAGKVPFVTVGGTKYYVDVNGTLDLSLAKGSKGLW